MAWEQALQFTMIIFLSKIVMKLFNVFFDYIKAGFSYDSDTFQEKQSWRYKSIIITKYRLGPTICYVYVKIIFLLNDFFFTNSLDFLKIILYQGFWNFFTSTLKDNSNFSLCLLKRYRRLQWLNLSCLFLVIFDPFHSTMKVSPFVNAIPPTFKIFLFNDLSAAGE